MSEPTVRALSPESALPPIVRATGVQRRFGATLALADFSLEARAGEMVGLVGPDGAGKTTAMRILAGMIGADAGEVEVLGHAPLSSAQALRTALGYMPQQYSLYGDLTVEENLRFFSRMFSLDRPTYRARRERLLEITRLGRFTDRRADALSGGMYKKLALACALLPRPRLLLMDEPTNGVDPVSRRELWELLFELTAEGMGIVVSTPYMDEAARCHRIHLMYRGRVVLGGTPADLLGAFPGSVLLAERVEPALLEAALEGRREVVALSVAGHALRVVVRPGGEAATRAALLQLGARPKNVRPEVEDLFLAATADAPRADDPVRPHEDNPVPPREAD
ncbi:MAG: ABC transporter ATP-binding protein [Deltaproteobacteria bacterium]|nr:ABC transporter ATP-binding protein [Deltaproteobacteria bacterium]